MVGVGSAEYEGPTEFSSPAQDLREQEYLLGRNQERCAVHERFFVYEVVDWAARPLGVSTNREKPAVFGFSEGGAFAVSLGIRHPDQFSTPLAFCLGEGSQGWGAPV